MLTALNKAGLLMPVQIPYKWVVNCKSVGSGEKALTYLGRYLYKGVIQEKDIVACKDGQVSFRYRDSKTQQMKTRTVSGVKFLWLILRHVLPRGFRRARHFGFLHPNSKCSITLLQYLLGFDRNKTLTLFTKRPHFICQCCGALMHITRTRIAPSALATLVPT